MACGLLATSCQEVEQPSTVLTQEQWNKVKQHILEDKPETDFGGGAIFGDKIKLVGFDVDAHQDASGEPYLVPGETTTFTWYWKVLDDVDENWKIFVHFDSDNSNVDPAKRRQNLDHAPLDGLYPTSRWKKGKIIEDVQEVTIRSDYPTGTSTPYIGFYKGKKRLPITNKQEDKIRATEDNRFIGASIEIKNPDGSEGASKKKMN
jgi:hypothetical protein